MIIKIKRKNSILLDQNRQLRVGERNVTKINKKNKFFQLSFNVECSTDSVNLQKQCK